MNAMVGDKVVYGGLNAYRTRGDYLRRLEQYSQSIVAHDEAFNINPDDIKNLTGRGQSCSMALKSQQAYENARLALRRDPRNLHALKVKAQAMYTMTQFERSIVANSRGNKIRPSLFKDGLNKGLQTVEDCVGTRAGQVLLDFLPLIKRAEAQHIDEPPKPLRVSRIPRQDPKPKISQKEADQSKTVSRLLAMKYLGPMAYDKFFIESLRKDKRIISANEAGTRELDNIINEGYKTLADRQELLHGSRPYYAIRQAEKSVSTFQTKFLEKVLQQECLDSTRMADRLLTNVKRAKRARNISSMIKMAERMQIYLDSKTAKTLPIKDTYIQELYNIVGDGYMSQYHLSFYDTEQSHRDRIAFLMGLPLVNPKSYDPVRANYPYKYGDIKNIIEKLTETLETCEIAAQRCWIYFDLSRLFVTQKKYPQAKFYAKQCQHEAEANDLPVWWINGCFAILSGDLKQGNAGEVKVLVKEAEEWVERLESKGHAVGLFLKKCAEIANYFVVTDDKTVIKQRERQVLRTMIDPERVEQGVMFKKIWTMPPGRRFNVVPKKVVAGPMVSERQRYRQPGLTLIPGQTPTLPVPDKSAVKGCLKVDW